jgi:exopolysaccharide production protein ExoY
MSAGLSEVAGAVEGVPDFAAASSIGPRRTWRRRPTFDSKRLFDFHCALGAIVLLAPLLATVALTLLVLQGRPVLIRHRRVGRGGSSFPCFKFRTMVRDADKILQAVLAQDTALQAEWAETRKLRRDPRITSFGRVLRESSVDEVPQLFNILLGHMSFVGPRPIVADEVDLYGVKIHHYYQVRPGLTGAWQIGGRSDVGFATRVDLDSAYVQSWTFRADLVILAKTVPVVLKRTGSC